jgi:hypothetical protein
MKAYMFKAALYCEDCADDLLLSCECSGIEDDGDSDTFPQGPYSEGGGEADYPQNCDNCSVFLENPITDVGDYWLRGLTGEFENKPDMSWEEIARAAETAGQSHKAEYFRFYFAPGQ